MPRRPRPKIDSRQLPAVKRFLAQMEPQDELTYRLALTGLFSDCRFGEWSDRQGAGDRAGRGIDGYREILFATALQITAGRLGSP
jgi:hypothetical protein